MKEVGGIAQLKKWVGAGGSIVGREDCSGAPGRSIGQFFYFVFLCGESFYESSKVAA